MSSKKRYTDAFKADAARQALHSDKSHGEIAKELGVSRGSIRRWVSEYEESQGGPSSVAGEGSDPADWDALGSIAPVEGASADLELAEDLDTEVVVETPPSVDWVQSASAQPSAPSQDTTQAKKDEPRTGPDVAPQPVANEQSFDPSDQTDLPASQPPSAQANPTTLPAVVSQDQPPMVPNTMDEHMDESASMVPDRISDSHLPDVDTGPSLGDRLLTLHLVFSILAFVGIGFVSMVNTENLLRTVGVQPMPADQVSGLIELQAMYGGMEMGMGLFLIVCLMVSRWRVPGVLAASLTVGGLGLTRIGCMALSSTWIPIHLTLSLVEVGSLVFGFVVLMLTALEQARIEEP